MFAALAGAAARTRLAIATTARVNTLMMLFRVVMGLS